MDSSQNPRPSSHFFVVVHLARVAWYCKTKIIQKFKNPYISLQNV
jgi:hypothetical protein